MCSSNYIRSQERHDPTSSDHNRELESDTAQTGNAGDDVALYSPIKCYWNIVRVLDQSSSFKRGIAWQTLISRHHRCLVRRPQYPIPTTVPSRPTAAAKMSHRPTSVRRPSPYQACQAAILGFLESYLPFLVIR
jgi:hypothetical protein